MIGILVAIFVIICVLLITAVLIQSNKGTSIAGLFGGGSDTFLGASSAVSWVNKMTTYLAVAFLVVSFLLMLVPLIGESQTGGAGYFPDVANESQEAPVSPAAPVGEGAGQPPVSNTAE